MKLLVLGGPKFLGRAIADATLARGHELTFFNRGRTNTRSCTPKRGSSAAIVGMISAPSRAERGTG